MKTYTWLLILIFLLCLCDGFILCQNKTRHNIEDVFVNYFRDMIRLDPELGSRLGVTKKLVNQYRKDLLTDISDEAETAGFELMRKYKTILELFNKDEVSTSQLLSRDILLWYIKDYLAGEPFRYHAYWINPKFGFHYGLTTLMSEYHPVETVKDARDYISRLAQYRNKFEQVLKGINIRAEKGLLPPIFIIEETARILSDFISCSIEKNVLYSSFARRIKKKLKNSNKEQKKKILADCQKHLQDIVYPSYRETIDLLGRLKQHATSDAGVWKLPGGSKYYEYCLRYHTTTDLKPQEVHQLGIKEVQRIQKAMMRILKSLGIKQKEHFYEMINLYWREMRQNRTGQFYYANTRRSRNTLLNDYRKIINSLKQKIRSCFSIIPRTPVQVLPVAEFKQSSIGAHYSPATLDGRHPGVFYVNNSYLPQKPGMKTLTCHEAIPGHHFQFAIQQESIKNRLFRNLFFFTGYVEGWALYAEKLALEQGWFSDDHEKLGYLSSELLRAARLVLDTGIHYKKWTRDQAYRYMVYSLGWGSYRSIDRYIVWPGQACAYKIGELKILELRAKAKKTLGRKFDLKEFHRVVLQHGSLPLKILEGLVDEYIKKGKKVPGKK